MAINSESEWAWNEEVMAYCKILSKSLPKGTDNNLEKPQDIKT
jgi:hypothetical protein